MTEEQIKQNAEDFAHKVNVFAEDESVFFAAKDGYIAGAHSRNEEIKELEKKVSALETVIVTARAAISTQEAIIKDFRNPRISVKYRLSEKIKNKGVSKNVFVTWPDGTLGKVYYNYEEYKAPR